MRFVNTVKANVIANFVGQGVNILLMLFCIPLYVRFMGVEAYGLVGLYLTLMALVSPLDLGLPTTLNRQLAILSARKGGGQDMRDMARTLETLVLGLAFLVCAMIVAIAPLVANHWISPENVSRDTVRETVMLIGLAIAVFWPATLYTAGIMGLERQVALNGVAIAMDILRFGGSLVVIWRVSATPQAFFLWQVAVNALHSLVLGWLLWRALPRADAPGRFKWRLLADVRRFALGLSGIAVASLAQNNMDRIVLSKLCSLKQFGYYVLAIMATGVLFKIIGPIHAAFFPKFSRHAGHNNHAEVAIVYHRACQTLSAFLLPVAAVMVVYAKEILLVWTMDPVVADNAHVVLSALSVGAALVGVAHFPYAAQLAYGWTRLAFFAAIAMAIATIPLLMVMTKLWGLPGAACVPMILRAVYALIVVPAFHGRYLKGELRQWCLYDIGLPLAACLAVVVPCRYFIYAEMPHAFLVASLASVTVAAVAASLLAAPETRNGAKTLFS